MTRSDPPEAGPRASRRPTLSLKGRALKYLAAREHSRVELTRKLAPHAESPEQVSQVLDELEQKGWLSAQRQAASSSSRRMKWVRRPLMTSISRRS